MPSPAVLSCKKVPRERQSNERAEAEEDGVSVYDISDIPYATFSLCFLAAEKVL